MKSQKNQYLKTQTLKRITAQTEIPVVEVDTVETTEPTMLESLGVSQTTAATIYVISFWGLIAAAVGGAIYLIAKR